MSPEYCPECRALITDSSSCVCGWRNKVILKDVDARCYYTFNGERCPLVGTVVEGTKSNGWLCRAHYFTRHNPVLAKAVFDDIKKNFKRWATPQKSWRLILLEECLKKYPTTYSGQKKTVDELLKELKSTLKIREER